MITKKIERSEHIAVCIICFQNYSQDMNSSSKKWEVNIGEGHNTSRLNRYLERNRFDANNNYMQN